jgi:predicted nucleic acid-binding Zn ribbon protein
MQFPFQCKKCGKRFDGEYPIGKAPRVTPCPSCKGTANRIYEGLSLSVKIGGDFLRSSKFGEEMKAKNSKAASKMRGRVPPVRRVATDYGNGKIEAVAKK